MAHPRLGRSIVSVKPETGRATNSFRPIKYTGAGVVRTNPFSRESGKRSLLETNGPKKPRHRRLREENRVNGILGPSFGAPFSTSSRLGYKSNKSWRQESLNVAGKAVGLG